ncbi:hypothetical protein PW52_16000 [Tamlana sedimentorum]|uniref:Peptide synthetase n=1 Tax=Neotamlana sedimentorum TaxID=1435349 RepID=A0A0D7W2D7_9FLAO|nr:type I polyketide synthase [Tamlana sedimentorum]KJD32012.1 hypothetical protein PW52_16000 [Tamlana sedimentorum]
MMPQTNLYQLFENTANRYPDNVCIVLNNKSITYKQAALEVNRRHNKINRLIAQEQIVGISTTRSIDQIINLLTLFKANKAYLPLDFNYPNQRLNAIINNAKLKVCLTDEAEEAKANSLGLLTVNSNYNASNLEDKNTPNSLAYILYTSGSTGEPKGVSMGKNAIFNLLEWQNNNSVSTIHTKTLQFAPLSFDVSFQEIMATFNSGGTLVLINDSLRLNMDDLLVYIKQQKVNRLFLPFAALQAIAEIAVNTNVYPESLKEIMAAGEQLKITPQIKTFFNNLNHCILYNQYGPTECHVVTELKLTGPPNTWPALPSIGKPILNAEILILNKDLKPLPNGEQGELCITGTPLAEGYLNNPSLTNEKFVDWTNADGKTLKIYRTGDIAKYLPDGNIEFLGRQDDQVKISGHRIELAEIEIAVNNINNVQQTVVLAVQNMQQTQLVAYVQFNNKHLSISKIKEETGNVLPEYMMPSLFIEVEDFPRTASGKINKKALPKPEYKRPENAPVLKKATTKTQKIIVKIWEDLLGIPEIGIYDNFFDMGGTSLLAQKISIKISKETNKKLPVTKIYQFPTIEALSFILEGKTLDTKNQFFKKITSLDNRDIAIIGMSGRFPGANTITELWDVLKNAKETIRFFSHEELDKTIPEHIKNNPQYVAARGIIPTAKTFDAAFFGLNPKLAACMDPQQRLFLEIAWEVLEQTGYLPEHFNGSVGVYAGVGMNSYFKKNILPNQDVLNSIGDIQADSVNEKDYIATRTAYHLNLKGPAVSVHSACSTSLLAIAHAVEALRNNLCEVAIAGGASVTAPINSGHLYQEGSIMSPDGHCRSFDAQGKGTVFSDGAGVVLLKRLEDAQNDADTIYGIIKGIGINNDGGNKGSFSAPNATGQTNAIKKALFDADVLPETISYVETHGTATPIGDPIEFEGLNDAFGEQEEKQFCAIGSIKSNMGHLTAAAGVAGLIKSVLALHNKQIPASLGYKTPNPQIDFKNSPFYVNAQLQNWKSATVRRAGVSSFGVGGTNVHVVLEEFENNNNTITPTKFSYILPWSAKTETSVNAYADSLITYLEQNPETHLGRLSYTLNKTRAKFKHRKYIITDSVENAIDQLKLKDFKPVNTNTYSPSELVFMFPGQGAQFLNMGKALYENEPVFKEAVDKCALILIPILNEDIRNIIYPNNSNETAKTLLKDTKYTQPALFIIEYALAQLWLHWGLKPTAFCGHSIGEFVAAHLAGVFSLEDALKLIATRGKLVSELPKGSMLSVRLSVEDIKPILPKSLSIAAANSSVLCVVSGEDEAIKNFSAKLSQDNIVNKQLLTSHAFHSSMMNPILNDFKKVFKNMELNAPSIPISSTVTGTWLKAEEATNPDYWVNHLRETVQFSEAIKTILNLNDVALLEVGPGKALTTLTKQQTLAKHKIVLPSLTIPKDKETAYDLILNTVGQLWINDISVNWDSFFNTKNIQRLNLPAYAFDRKLCWIEPITPHQNVSFIEENKQSTLIENNSPVAEQTNKITPMRKPALLNKISEIITNSSGIEIESTDYNYSFLELGLDSLILTQIALTCKNEFNIPISFRQLNEELSSPELLASFLDNHLPKEAYATQQLANNNLVNLNQSNNNQFNESTNHTALDLITQQLQLLGKQVELLQKGNSATPIINPNYSADNSSANQFVKAESKHTILTEEEQKEHKKPFGASPKIEKQSTELAEQQSDFLKQLITDYNNKTKASKNFTQEHRKHMADPRVVSGFKPTVKELIYPIVIEKSKGNKLWDIDGNQYIDALNGFGSCLFGHQPEFIKEALKNQIELGYEVGPQHPLAGDVCKLLCEATNQDRAALCNTGSEAVLGAMRIARTVTGRSLIVAFSGSYHGINDEVIVRGSKKLKTFPAAPGILSGAVQNMLILDYGTEESLQIIKERAHEIAAVLVEPVQSRRPEFQPVAFLKSVREITQNSNAVLIFDEVITGFRMHIGGTQALFNIKADISTYGKVIGGGMPIGAIVGKKQFMDALDGGFWQYGDSSFPEVGVTYFAGTFVRHPLTLAAAKASLLHMINEGDKLHINLNIATKTFADKVNQIFNQHQLPIQVNYFGSLWRVKFLEDIPYSELLFVLLRNEGIHIWDGFPCFITTAFTEEDFRFIIKAFNNSVNCLIENGIFNVNTSKSSTQITKKRNTAELNTPPIAGAKLGLDEDGNPAWFIEDNNENGNFIKLDI